MNAKIGRLLRLLDAQAATERTINHLMLALLGIGLVGALSVNLPDSYLLTTTSAVSVPFAGAISFKIFLIIGPLLLFAVRLYLQIYIVHWRRLDRLTRRSHIIRTPIVSPLRHPLLKIYSWFVLYALVPWVLYMLTGKAMVVREWGVSLLFLTFASICLLVCSAFSSNWKVLLGPPALLFWLFVFGAIAGVFDGYGRPFQLQLANLERAILKDQDLRRANLANANLEGSDLFDANLQDAYMSGVNLRRAHLLRTNLKGAILWGADLQEAAMGSADLQDAGLTGANLQMAYIEGANFKGADLARANLQKADLMSAYLRGADLSFAKLQTSFLGRADLSMATGWATVDYTGAKFCQTTMPDGTIEQPDCNIAEAFQAWKTERESGTP